MATRTPRPVRVIKESNVCFFDKNRLEPDYRDVETLKRFVSDRARIYPRARSGICAKHQRGLAVAIKRARHLGLLPFTSRV